MNINYLIEYVYLAESLSFRKTADYFYVSRSVISRHLASLEEMIGTKLVERGNRSAQLTEAGRVFYREAQTVLRAYANAIDRTREAGHASGQKVRLGYLKNAARPVIVRFVSYMHHEHPEIQLETTCMEFSELRRALDEETIDIALGVNVHPSLSRNYRRTPVYTDRFYAVMSKSHPLANHAEGIAFKELLQQKLLLPDSFIYGGLNELIDGIAGEHQAVASDYYRDVDMLYLKVQTEDYVAFSSGLNNAMFGDRLTVLPITGVDTSFSVSAFYGERFEGAVFEACCKGFESCHNAMAAWDAKREGSAIGFSFVGLD